MKNKHKTERMNKTKIGSMKKLIYGKMAQKKKRQDTDSDYLE